MGHWVFPLVSLRINTVGTPLYKVTPGQTAITEAMFWGNVIRNKMSLFRKLLQRLKRNKTILFMNEHEFRVCCESQVIY